MAIVITAAIEKGGAAKTTTVVNLAALAAQEGKRVLVVDTDRQANSTFMLTGCDKFSDQFRGHSLYNMFRTYEESASVARFICDTNIPGVKIIPSDKMTDHCERILLPNSEEFGCEPYQFLALCLATVAEDYDFIFIDTPPATDLFAQSAIYASDYVIIPMQTDQMHLAGFRSTYGLINSMNRKEQIEVKVLGILFTLWKKNEVSAQFVEETLAESGFAGMIFNTRIRNSTRVKQGTFSASPIVLDDKRNNVSKDYQALYQEIKEKIAGEEE